jgi:hypothetical protein
LYGASEDVGDRRRQSDAVGRLLKRPYMQGLIVDVPHSDRWHVGKRGQQVPGAGVELFHHGSPAALRTAA